MSGEAQDLEVCGHDPVAERRLGEELERLTFQHPHLRPHLAPARHSQKDSLFWYIYSPRRRGIWPKDAQPGHPSNTTSCVLPRPPVEEPGLADSHPLPEPQGQARSPGKATPGNGWFSPPCLPRTAATLPLLQSSYFSAPRGATQVVCGRRG